MWITRSAVVVAAALGVLSIGAPANGDLSLGYQADAYAYARAVACWMGDSEEDESTDSDSQIDAGVSVEANAVAEVWEWVMPGVWELRDADWVNVAAATEASATETTMLFSLTLNQDHDNSFQHCSPGGEEHATTHLSGTFTVNPSVGFPSGSQARLLLDAGVVSQDWGDTYTWLPISWQFDVWDTDPQNPIVSLNEANLSDSLILSVGDSLNVDFYSEARGGLSAPSHGGWSSDSVSVTAELIPEPSIPTLSEYGLIILAVLVLGAGAIVLRTRRRTLTAS